ncbi:hypothetical protein AFULGI_00025120 [Archaeoglobus fulgidus DSM 8774]|uniref:Uncharacterized protein n=1 Tax=Archaeoglobus fulgidus DSM 8774 TaxID=1344584 RepID=A0A075WHF4_ARCFL|nr:hypothetical protein [Archaeoglobus fulgidus]AIG99227.1 hypothetical protein AFULGI_00025120 [Archaeoglobus fulgidus DSM 8774]
MKIVKPGRIWYKRTKKGELIPEKLLVDLPRTLSGKYSSVHAEIVYHGGSLLREGTVWNEKTAEVYIPVSIAKEMPGDEVEAEIQANGGELKVRFVVR